MGKHRSFRIAAVLLTGVFIAAAGTAAAIPARKPALGKPDLAVTYYREALRHKPAYPGARHNLATAQRRLFGTR